MDAPVASAPANKVDLTKPENAQRYGIRINSPRNAERGSNRVAIIPTRKREDRHGTVVHRLGVYIVDHTATRFIPEVGATRSNAREGFPENVYQTESGDDAQILWRTNKNEWIATGSNTIASPRTLQAEADGTYPPLEQGVLCTIPLANAHDTVRVAVNLQDQEGILITRGENGIGLNYDAVGHEGQPIPVQNGNAVEIGMYPDGASEFGDLGETGDVHRVNILSSKGLPPRKLTVIPSPDSLFVIDHGGSPPAVAKVLPK